MGQQWAPDRVSVEGKCNATGGVSPDLELSADVKCEGKVVGTWDLKTGAVNATDILALSIDTGAGTIEVISDAGPALITIKDSGGSLHATSFSWELLGTKIVPSDVNALTAWASQFNGSIAEVSVDVQDIYVNESSGPNTFVTEVKYGDTLVAGDSESWYSSPSNCDGFYPDHQLCY